MPNRPPANKEINPKIIPKIEKIITITLAQFCPFHKPLAIKYLIIPKIIKITPIMPTKTPNAEILTKKLNTAG